MVFFVKTKTHFCSYLVQLLLERGKFQTNL